ncbi:MAG: hypothetical protein AUH29_17365 [Candidatus Rokubacteria bacterium 13_1_40CM_69_27]|nr:MAG: hypothetical protein AUH29_17365 [Candidatus Rokubacteria bacterium 13_1_40CM_69_27]OLC39740.1 MAG: hypothetical protein AUH81_00755 [Candidatus Rokubacteria bacterium 13_1_40CM_4_69_5]
MSVKLFVGGLSFTTSNESLREAFARFGTVASALVMTDRETGRSRGFGFVEMSTTEEAERAISGLNGSMLDGRAIRVDKATPRGARGTAPARRPGGPPPSRGGFGGGGGGGFPPRGGGPGGGGGADRPWGDARGPGRSGQGRGERRRGSGEGDPRRPGGPRRGRPTNERRSDDKGRRGEDSGYRW